MSADIPVAIVGAGPVGVTLALLLARRGVASVVLERHPEPYPLPRAVHLDDEVFRILQAAGVAREFAAISRSMPGMRLVDAQLATIAEFARGDGVGRYGHPRASMFDQPELEALLLARAVADPLIDLQRGREVTGLRGTTVLTTAGEVGARWVVGCDGANSLVRSAIGAGFRDLGFEERWLVVDVRSPEPLEVWGGVQQVCDPRRAATFMHVVGERYRWEFRLAAHEAPEDLVRRLEELIGPWTRGVAVEVLRQAEYTFRARVADRWRAGNVLIAGDAAHQTPPFVGQGLGAGLRDADNLAWKIAAALEGPDDLLDTYEAERRPHVTRVIRSAMIVGRALTGGQDAAAALRRVALSAAGRIPAVTRAAASTTSPRLTAGPLVRRTRSDRLAGTLCPQPYVGFDDLLGDGWCVVSRGPVRAGLRGLDVTVDPRHAPVLRWLEEGRAAAVLVRPDRVVAATVRGAAGHRAGGVKTGAHGVDP